MLLQEFYAGRGVPSGDFFGKVVSARIRWKHPLLFYFGEHPQAHEELEKLITTTDELSGWSLFRAAVAIGLAVQACYLARVADKARSLEWVFRALARAEPGYIEARFKAKPGLPLMAFLDYYLIGRDSVACEAACAQTESSANILLGVDRDLQHDLEGILENRLTDRIRRTGQGRGAYKAV